MGKIYAQKDPAMSEREKRNQERMKELASQGMVLLENDGTLPVAPGKIALYGVGARYTVKGGTGSGDVNSRNVVNVEQGLLHAGYEITTTKWLDAYDAMRAKAYEEWADHAAEGIRKGESFLAYVLDKTFKDPEAQEITKEDVATSDTDTAIYVISRNSGEGKDRYDQPGDYELREDEKRNLTFLGAHYAHVAVLLNVGGIIDTSFLRDTPGIGAVLLMSQAGNISGDAVANVLSGKVNPSGKLTDTWAEKYEDYPYSKEFSHNDGELDEAYYKEGIYVGYRYFDTFNVTPAYCFGYGKSYTDFSWKAGQITVEEGKAVLSVEVENIGKVPGREVIQLYVSAPAGRVEKPYQELKAFGKTKLLAPGEREVMTLSWTLESMASYLEEEASWILEKGFYYVRVGNSSRNTKITGALRVEETLVVSQGENSFPLDCEMEELKAKGVVPCSYEGAEEEKRAAKAQAVTVQAEAIPERKVIYSKKALLPGSGVRKEENPEDGQNIEGGSKAKNGQKSGSCGEQTLLTLEDVKAGQCSLEAFVSSLSPEELTSLCVGKVHEDFSIIGNASATVPGAAGDSTDSLVESRRIPSVIMADGPAGLRLTREFKVDVDGHVIGDSGFILPKVMRDAMEEAEGHKEKKEAKEVYYQYCTAIPVATLLAQSWDMELIEQCGSIVGEEMQEFGVNLWLAPGMNIHRNPLCGRNFEYYSEDPLLSGRCAAADTKGVQKHQGTGTTIKHFAVNNQEDNRLFANSHVSERALREIYLKGFEICVREAQPMAVMTSYNLLNGLHTANSESLLIKALRDEWGFEGLVMTDWGTTSDASLFKNKPKYPGSSPALCIKAGNDLIMPGFQSDLDDIRKSLDAEAGEVYCPLKLEDLQYTAANILRVILRLF